MDIANLSDAEFKTLVIRMLRDLIEYGKSWREEMKATLSEIKKNPQGTNSKRKEAWGQVNELEHKEEINSYRILRTIRRTPQFGRKMGVSLIVQM